MDTEKHFDILIVVTPADCERLLPLYPRLLENFENGNLCFIGSEGVGELVAGSSIKDRAGWINENDIVPFDEVHACMSKSLAGLLNGETLPRGVTGWYYQQFLKMQYSDLCQDEYYMVWDGDTIPCRKINMFNQETGQPYLDLKHEHHTEYFDTIGKLFPGFGKVIERSFISEHMLFKKDIMKQLISDIEENDQIEGERFWEKIINAIEPEKIADSSFSEFETYGTYVALKCPNAYRLREWHSFRLGGSFYEINTITDGDFKWLGVDFDAISFEKGQRVLDENRGYFDNPDVQRKISAKKLLQAAQMEYRDGYKEVWEDDLTVREANVRTGGYGEDQGVDDRTLIIVKHERDDRLLDECVASIKGVLNENTYRIEVVVNDAKAINAAVLSTKGTDYENADVFLIDADTRLIFDSLYFLKQALYSSEDIGACGSLSNRADNKQQVDVRFDTVEEYIKFGEKINVPTESPYLERTRLSGFAMLVRRKVWDEIGGLDEGAELEGSMYDEISLEILRKGFRLQLVRNSFIYRDEDIHESCSNSCASMTDASKRSNVFAEKYGFDYSDYMYASGTVISQIPYGQMDRFAVLHFGCGLGAEMKAIRSLFPYSDVYGVETRGSLYEIVRKTEKVFESIDELLEFISVQFFNVIIIEDKVLCELAEEERTIISALLMPGPVVIVKNNAYETFPYDRIKLIMWDMDDTFWQGSLDEGEIILPMSNVDLIKDITDHGVVNSVYTDGDEKAVFEELEKAGIARLFVFNKIGESNPRVDIADVIKRTGLMPEDVLYIDDDPEKRKKANEVPGLMIADPQIIPYLSNFYAKTKALDTEHKQLEAFRKMKKES